MIDTIVAGLCFLLLFTTFSFITNLPTLSQLKLMVMLREPVQRAYSHYRFLTENMVKHDIDTSMQLPFEAMITGELDAYEACEREHVGWDAVSTWIQCYNETSRFSLLSRRSMYDAQIAHWQQHIPHRTYYCIISHAFLLHTPHVALRTAALFLGLASFTWDDVVIDAHSSAPHGPTAAEDIPISKHARTRLDTFFTRTGSTHW